MRSRPPGGSGLPYIFTTQVGIFILQTRTNLSSCSIKYTSLSATTQHQPEGWTGRENSSSLLDSRVGAAIFTPGLPAGTNALLATGRPAGLTVLGCMRVDEEVVPGRRLRLEGLAGSRLVLHGRAGCVLC